MKIHIIIFCFSYYEFYSFWHILRNTFGDKVFKTVIPRNVRISEAPRHGKPALFYDFKSSGAQAYLRVATEVVNALERKDSK